MNKILIGFLISSAVMATGLYLRLHAHAIAWAGVTSWTEPGSATEPGRNEACYSEIALVLMSAGGLLLVVTFGRWLFTHSKRGQ